ncbi:L,D-transpeptidase family protein [Pseudooceanicola sp. CBS1P-1]|uniref:L,D-transpeptidase family protein n=2 Tax=Paracoccaceae TaxID=31989 RepID=A0A6L7G2H6_9RHOB|nr:L,D-transpeptidase family protein [Pseudooceanicola endophyticus]MXN17636.1 L,D-transpeptidase family protein [Pseudooceanicola albus]
MQGMSFRQGVAMALADVDSGIADYYRSRDFAPVWTGEGPAYDARRSALLEAVRMMPENGLPASLYTVEGLVSQMRAATSGQARGRLDVELSATFIRIARDLQTGILTPHDVVPEILRKVPLRDSSQYLDLVQGNDPLGYVHSLPPQTAQYAYLMKARYQLQQVVEAGGYGPVVSAGVLKPGNAGAEVGTLRNRLAVLGYDSGSLSTSYDASLISAVKAFQKDAGLTEDGVAGPATLSLVNRTATENLEAVIVAMERERWINRPLGERHIWVNLADFSAKIVDDGVTTFRTRAVIGARQENRQSPEFSDVMEYMSINPSWNVPRSIVVNEYLPQMQQDPSAASQLELIDARGQVVPRQAVDFTQYTASNFPFDLREPPSERNALGLVKFMFPNPNNIYLHDTPSKYLFAKDMRAYSHGCIRLAQPFDFAYALLARQVSDPQQYFQSKLDTGKQVQVNLKQPIQVHLVYRTAFADGYGRIHYRNDIYNRDARIWQALSAQGVALTQVRS